MEKRHSALGVASFLLALFMWFGFIVLAVAALFTSDSSETEGGSAVNMGIGLGLFVDALIGLLATVLGIVSLFQSGRKKIFGILGLALSLLAIVLLVALTAFGKWA